MNNGTVFIVSAIQILNGNSAGAVRLRNIAKAIASNGMNCVHCSYQNDGSEAEAGKLREVGDGIFSLVSSVEQKKFSKLKYPLNMVRFVSRVKQEIMKMNGPVYIYMYPSVYTILDILVLIWFKLFYLVPIFYDVNELRRTAIGNIAELKLSPKNILRKLKILRDRFMFMLVEHITKYYTGLVVISTALEEYFKKYNSNIVRVPILSDCSDFSPVMLSYKKNEVFKMCFTGSINIKKEGLDTLLSSLKQLHPISWQLDFYGPIASEDKEVLLGEIIPSLNIGHNVHFHGVVPQSEILTILRQHHLLLLPRPLNEQVRYGFSTKLSEYLVSGIPVLVTNVSDNGLYIRDGINGYIIEPFQQPSIHKKILEIIDNYSECAGGIAENAFKTACREFHYANYGKSLVDFFNRKI